MKALVFHAPGEVAVETVPDPGLNEDHEVVVAVQLSAVCGSDLHVYRGHESGLDDGTVMGHEFLGEVVEVGPAVCSLRRGTRVVSPFTTSCGNCFYCRTGLTARCEEGQLFGWVEGGQGLHGAQAEYVRVPLADATLLEVPEGPATDEEVLFAGDVLSTGYYCAESGGVAAGAAVAILGCGPVGLMAIAACVELGADRIFAFDAVPERLELARRFGAEPVDFTSDGAAESVLQATGGRGVDIVLEAVGSPQATRLAVDLARPGGTIAAAGVHTETTFAFSPVEAYDKNLTYRAGRCPARHYMERTLAMIQSGRHPLADIVSHRLPLAEGARAYDMFDRKTEGCTKAILLP